MTNNKKGFTLIELLVVIAIIGILSAIGLVSLNGAREKARDAARKSDLGQYKTALVLYYDDNGSKYPGNAAGTADTNDLVSKAAGLDSAVAGAGKFLGAALVDPINAIKNGTGAGDYRYYYVSDVNTTGASASTYGLNVDLEEKGATNEYYVSLNSAKTITRAAAKANYHCGSATVICD